MSFKIVQPVRSISCPIDTIYCAKLGKKLPVFPWKKNEDFIRVFSILVIYHPFELQFMPINYRFEGKNIPYKMIQNSIWSNDRIKKSTFLPYLVRVLVLIVAKMVFKYCDLLIHHPIMLYLFFTRFGFKIHDFSPFSIFLIFLIFILIFLSLFCCMNLSRKKYNIDRRQIRAWVSGEWRNRWVGSCAGGDGSTRSGGWERKKMKGRGEEKIEWTRCGMKRK